MAEDAPELSPTASAAPALSTEVTDATAATTAAAAAADATAAAPPAADDAPSKAEEPNNVPNDASKPSEPAATNADPDATEDKTTMDVSADKDAAAAAAEDASAANGTPSTGKKDNKRRKSSAAVPEHKGKNLKKKQSMLHLDVQPGQFWWVRMKGYPNWPAVVCDEEMLPAALLSNRPVSAMRTDGSYRDDFNVGGKNARDRRYPVMFLGTNEFNWVVNTDLQPLDMDEIKAEIEKDSRGKKTLSLWEAYHVAAEELDLDGFKEMLRKHEEAIQADIKEKAEKDAKKAEREEKKKEKEKRKSQSAKDEDGDEAMGEAGEGTKKTPAKKKTPGGSKRKAPPDEDVDGQPTQGPKKIKIRNNAADAANEEKKKAEKPTKKASKGRGKEQDAKPEEPQMTEKEKLDKKEKHILYLRHRLQKGFLSRDQAPKEEEMDDMNGYFDSLEDNAELEVTIIRGTKINKVLKAILKLDTIPKDGEYRFKDRSNSLLNSWNKLLSSSGAAGEGDASAVTPTTTEAPKPVLNGASHEDESKKSEEPQKDTVMSESAEATKESSTEADEADVSMTDAKPTEAEAPSAAPAAEEEKTAPVAAEVSATA